MSEIKNIENLFVAGISLIKSTLEQEKLKSNDRYFWISKEVSNSIKKVLINKYKNGRIDLSNFASFSKEDKDRVIVAFEKMALSYDCDNYRWGKTSVMYAVLSICNKIFDSENSFIEMSQYFIASEVTDYQISSHLLREGYFKSMSIFSDILENWQGDEVNSILELAIDKCDSSILHKFKKHKNKNVRLKVYQRIGIQNCFEEMLKDKDRNVRLHALEWMPRDHEALSCLYGDRSKYVVSKLIKLISREKAIYLLGNSKVQKNKYLQEALQEKINEVW